MFPQPESDQFGYCKLANDLDLRGFLNTVGSSKYKAKDESGNEIELEGNWWKNDARKHKFRGTLDGCGKSLQGKSSDVCGVFGNLENASIKNVTIKDLWYNGGKSSSLFGSQIKNTIFENVTSIIEAGNSSMKASGTGTPSVENSCGYLANNTFQANTVKNCTFDASGWKLGSLFGWNTSMTPPTATNTIVKAASLVQALHSVWNETHGSPYLFQPENVTLGENEHAIKGLTFVKA